MIVSLSMPLETVYDRDGLGYGGFRIELPSGTQEVDDNFGDFLIEHHSNVVSEGQVAPSLNKAVTNPDTDPVVAAATNAIDALEAEVADLKAQIEANTVAKSTDTDPVVEPIVETNEPVAEPLLLTPEQEAMEITLGVNQNGSQVFLTSEGSMFATVEEAVASLTPPSDDSLPVTE